jgi:hypothetical protein
MSLSRARFPFFDLTAGFSGIRDRYLPVFLSTQTQSSCSKRAATMGATPPFDSMEAYQMMRLLSEFLRHILPGVIRPMQVLWNEIIGFLFLVLATFIGVSTWRRAQHFSGDIGGVLILVASCLFVALLAWFGISSFLRARKISRS